MTVLAALAFAAEKTPAQEGKDTVTVMLIVGLVFLAVVCLGQLLRWLGAKRHPH